jgi:ubiquinone/menaquinone biosynthesis C-methylase UbiE
MNTVCRDALNLPFKDGMFDCVFSEGVLKHFQDDEIVCSLNEQIRVSSGIVLFEFQ